jgi:hypothetical protein
MDIYVICSEKSKKPLCAHSTKEGEESCKNAYAAAGEKVKTYRIKLEKY